jgi:uncharacterized oligopeptide transporter (OPT) family protein
MADCPNTYLGTLSACLIPQVYSLLSTSYGIESAKVQTDLHHSFLDLANACMQAGAGAGLDQTRLGWAGLDWTGPGLAHLFS